MLCSPTTCHVQCEFHLCQASGASQTYHALSHSHALHMRSSALLRPSPFLCLGLFNKIPVFRLFSTFPHGCLSPPQHFALTCIVVLVIVQPHYLCLHCLESSMIYQILTKFWYTALNGRQQSVKYRLWNSPS